PARGSPATHLLVTPATHGQAAGEEPTLCAEPGATDLRSPNQGSRRGRVRERDRPGAAPRVDGAGGAPIRRRPSTLPRAVPASSWIAPGRRSDELDDHVAGRVPHLRRRGRG